MFDLVSAVAWWSVLAAGFLATYFGYWLFSHLRHVQDYKKVPAVPILTYLELLKRASREKSVRKLLLRILMEGHTRCRENRVTAAWLGLKPIIFFNRPEAVEALLNNPSAITKAVEYRFLEPWLGTGLLTSKVDKWRRQRKLLTPAFHFQILENFMTTFNREAEVLTRKLESEIGKPWIDVEPPMTLCALDLICQTAMGVNLNIQSGGCKDYVEKVDELSELFYYRSVRPWLWPDFIFNYLSPAGRRFRESVKIVQDLSKKVIKEKKESFLNNKIDQEISEDGERKRKKAFLELLLELHLKDSSFTEENIKEEVDTFMLGGHDTTAMAISWTLYELGRHPEIQDKVYQELDGIFGDDRTREVTSDDLRKMKYLECTIKETLRLYPSVPLIGRILSEELKLDNIYTLPAGATCVVFIYALHRDPDQFPEPEIFDPDRFLPEKSCGRAPYAFVPFSAGPRNCIGQRYAMMQEKTVLAHILRRFKITSLDTWDRIDVLLGLILKNADPIRIRFELREGFSNIPKHSR